MIRIAAVIETLGRGGAERLLVETARLLDRSRFHLEVVTLYPVDRDYVDSLFKIGIDETCLGLTHSRQLAEGVWRLRRLILTRRIDLVHTHLFVANLVGRIAARLTGRPVISTLHGADHEPIVRTANPGITRRKRTILRWVDRVTAEVAHARIVAVSRHVAESASRWLAIPESRLRVIPNAVNLTRFRPDAERREHTRAALELEGFDVILCVGRLSHEKAHHLLFTALADARLRALPWVALLAGEGSLRTTCEAQIQSLGLSARVRLLGTRDDVPDLMCASELLVLPSSHEGFGLVLAEALASGLPVVASRIPPSVEIVAEGRTGLLFESGDATDLADCLRRLLIRPDLRRTMGARGRRDAESRFGVDGMVRALEDLYTEAVSSVKTRPRPGCE